MYSMYSYEIDQIIKFKKYHINPKTYFQICNTSPQISRVKYDPSDNQYEIWTDDSYYWKFNISAYERLTIKSQALK